MSTLQENLGRLRRFNAWVRRTDSELADESADLLQAQELRDVQSQEKHRDASANPLD